MWDSLIGDVMVSSLASAPILSWSRVEAPWGRHRPPFDYASLRARNFLNALTNGPHPEQRGASRAFVEGRIGHIAARYHTTSRLCSLSPVVKPHDFIHS